MERIVVTASSESTPIMIGTSHEVNSNPPHPPSDDAISINLHSSSSSTHNVIIEPTETAQDVQEENDDEKKRIRNSRVRVRRKAIRPNSIEADQLREFARNHQMGSLELSHLTESAQRFTTVSESTVGEAIVNSSSEEMENSNLNNEEENENAKKQKI